MLPLSLPPPLPFDPLPLDPSAALISQLAPQEGTSISVNGKKMLAPWRWENGSPSKFWLPLDLLEAQFGVSKTSAANGSLNLNWYGSQLLVPAENQRSLQDEVGVEVSEWFRNLGVGSQLQTSAKGTLLHTLRRTATVQIYLVIAPLLPELGALGKITRVATT